METEDGDDPDDIYDLGEDDEDAGDPTEVPVPAEVEDGDGEGVMENDPYNPEDWDEALGEEDVEDETR